MDRGGKFSAKGRNLARSEKANSYIYNMSDGVINDFEPIYVLYPCVRIFPMEEGFVVYDSKANFATFLNPASFDILKSYLLCKAGGEDIGFRENRNPTLCAVLDKLLSRGVFLPGPMKNLYMTCENDLKAAVDYYEANIVLRRFSLEVTRRCNLRCSYCPYSSGEGHRKHEALDLAERDALQAIDYYFEQYSGRFLTLKELEKAKVLKKASPGLGWYGGEPFLNFPLIERTMEHFLAKPWTELGIAKEHLHIAVTTNFTAVSDEILDFLAKHNVVCTVSLDGPKSENDKCRVFAEGNASVFDTVVGNLKRLAGRHPQYLRKKIFFSSVYVPEHQYKKCSEFFSEFQGKTGVPISGRRYHPQDMSRHGQVIPDPKMKLRHVSLELKNRDEYRNPFISKTKNEILEMIQKDTRLDSEVESWRNYFSIAVDNPSGSDSWNTQINCPIGFDALMVGADGKFYPCERTDQSLVIGDLQTGRDKRAIVDAYKKLNSVFDIDRCKSCWAVHSCKVCIAQLLKESELRILNSEECEYVRKLAELEMGRFFKCSAETPALVEAVRSLDERNYGICDLQKIREESGSALGKTDILNL